MIKTALNNPYCGVTVLWAPTGAGKTACSVAAAQEILKEDPDRIIVHLDASTYLTSIDPSNHLMQRMIAPGWFNKAAGIPVDSQLVDHLATRKASYSISQSIPPPTTIIIDNFDCLTDCSMQSITLWKEMIIAMSEQSTRTKQFNVLICVTSWKRAAKILKWTDNNMMLIADDPEMAKWSERDIRGLVDAHPHFRDWPVASIEELVRMGTAAGVPGFISRIAELRVPPSHFAAQHGASASRLREEWVQGGEALKGIIAAMAAPPSESSLREAAVA